MPKIGRMPLKIQSRGTDNAALFGYEHYRQRNVCSRVCFAAFPVVKYTKYLRPGVRYYLGV